MLKVELTENYGGLRISGDFDDLNNLYDSIAYFINYSATSVSEEIMQNHLYGFLYDVRHAYQGDREAILVDNYIQDDKRQWLGIKKKDIGENNLYFSFNYLLPDMILDVVLIKYFIDRIDNNTVLYNTCICMVNYFYSLVVDTLNGFLSSIKFNKLKRGLNNAYIDDKIFYPQWFELISINYSKLNKTQREKKFMIYMDEIYNYIKYTDYLRMKKDLEKLCEEKNCNLDNLHYKDYPNEIEW